MTKIINTTLIKIIGVVLVLLLLPTLLVARETYHPTMNRKMVTITWVREPQQVDAVLRKFEKDNGLDANVVAGLASFSGRRCTAHALEPDLTDTYATWVFAHEMLHCFRGDYHDW